MGKAFEKQIKGQGKKQVDALENLKIKEERKPIEDKSNNQPRATSVFNELINKRKEFIKELYDSVDYNNLKSEYVGPTYDVSKAFANHLQADIKLSKTQWSKMIQSGGFLGRLLGPLLKTGLPLIKNLIKPLAKSVLITLVLRATASAEDAGIHKKVLG